MQYYNECIQSNLLYENGKLKASENFVTKSDIWSYNTEKIVIVEYLYHLFNTFDDNYENQFSLASNPLRYDIDLINTIYDFSNELSTKKIENKEIYCGFIFHDEISQIRNNSIKSIELIEPFDFGVFNKIKNSIEVSNGYNIFFNVTKGKVTHIFLTNININEILLNPLSEDETFASRPLIVLIQGHGKVHFLEGRPDSNKIILQIFNSKPLIQDNNFIKQFIEDIISEISSVANDKKELFTKWIMSLSQKKHGTSILFKVITPEISAKLAKTIGVHINSSLFENKETYRHDISLLNSIVNPDGAVIFNNDLNPTNISTILPISQDSKETFGGARHNSVANFTKKFNCIGIVTSEDGAISIFKCGKRLIKF